MSKSRSYEKFLRDEHGIPRTIDGVEIVRGMTVFLISDENEIFSNTITCYVTCEERLDMYGTRLAATEEIIRRHREEIKELEARIAELQDNDHPDSAEN